MLAWQWQDVSNKVTFFSTECRLATDSHNNTDDFKQPDDEGVDGAANNQQWTDKALELWREKK